MGGPRTEDVLRAAQTRIVTTAVDDTAARLCTTNMQFGLAKILWLEATLGLKETGAFFGAPDATVTRNPNRWRAGFGYGGLVRWNPELVVLDAKPNGCGLLMGALLEDLDMGLLKQRLEAIRRDAGVLKGVHLQWDVEQSNHFLSLCTPEGSTESFPKGTIFLLHSSGGELRGPSALSPGLYWDRSEPLRNMASVLKTPWGPIRYLAGDQAQTYLAQVRAVHEFQMRRREALARRLFGDFEPLFHGMHQGLVGPGLMALGCYVFEAPGATGPLPEGDLVPVTLRPDEPVPLLRPVASGIRIPLSEGPERVQRELAEFLSRTVVLPHGGGVSYPRAESIQVRQEQDGKREFMVRFGPDETISFEHPRDLPFSYRGTEVVERTVRLGLATIEGQLRITWWVGGAQK